MQEKIMFEDGCIGLKLPTFGGNNKDFIAELQSTVTDVIGLSDEQFEDLLLMINTQLEGYVPYYDLGYELGWKFTNTRNILAVVICPMEEVK